MKNHLSTKDRPFERAVMKAEDFMDNRRAGIEALEMLGLLDLLSRATRQGDECKSTAAQPDIRIDRI